MKRSVLGALSERYGMEPKEFEITVRSMAMPEKHSDAEFAACCLVAKEHNLNPFTKEIYFMRTKGGGIQPIVGVDGWIRKCNEHPAFDGLEFEDIAPGGNMSAIKCLIHRKDRDHPIVVTEYLEECRRPTDTWKQMPSRMLRHRALIQCARVAFGFAGIMDPDEFEQWQERYRSDAARDITPAKAALIQDIPEPANEAAEPSLPEAEKAKADYAKPASTKPAKTDTEFLEDMEAAFAVANDLGSLNEVLVHNEIETEDRGLQQAVSDKYQKHKLRIYDGMT
jgi:phage recombination protein Bet